MPRGPKGEKLPADVIGNAVHVMRVATREIQDETRNPGVDYVRKGWLGNHLPDVVTLNSI